MGILLSYPLPRMVVWNVRIPFRVIPAQKIVKVVLQTEVIKNCFHIDSSFLGHWVSNLSLDWQLKLDNYIPVVGTAI